MIDRPFSYKKQVQLTSNDFPVINRCRRDTNRLGFAYLLVYVRLFNQFPQQKPFKVIHEIVEFIALQLDIVPSVIEAYGKRRETLTEHQDIIRHYLGLTPFYQADPTEMRTFVFQEACCLEKAHVLQKRFKAYLKQQGILEPSGNTFDRLIREERAKARQFIFKKLLSSLNEQQGQKLDDLLAVSSGPYSTLHYLKQAPQSASPSALLKLIGKLNMIKNIGLLEIDLSWLNNNFQRTLARHTQHCTVARLRHFTKARRYTMLICFLHQLYLSTIDDLVVMYDRIMTRVETKAETDIDNYFKARRNKIRRALTSFHALSTVFLDDDVPDEQVRLHLFKHISKARLKEQRDEIEVWLGGKPSHRFNLVVKRFSYLRQFAPQLLEQLDFEQQNDHSTDLLEAIELLRNMNKTGKRKLLAHPPIKCLSKTMQALIKQAGILNKPAWECAILLAIRDEIKAGNIAVRQSKRFVPIHEFFMPATSWAQKRSAFFARSGLPENPQEMPQYLTTRLNNVFDRFLNHLPQNTYASVDETGWQLSHDPAEKLSQAETVEMTKLETYLKQHMRLIKLPALLIEVDNDLQFTQQFMTSTQQASPTPTDICAIIATIMAHGCNIGPYTMAHLTNGRVSYSHLKHITDWMLTEESQRAALAHIVNAISRLTITQAWGSGKTSSSDGQRFALRRNLLQKTYSPTFNDFALEFYSFVADNYAPFYSTPIECTDRDAAYVLDGLLYNETELTPEEHYTDTHGYTEINFAAFALLGRTFCPRIRGIKAQRLYCIEPEKNYGPLSYLLNRPDRLIHLDWIVDQWDRLAHFYASLETGHTTASIALKRLNGFSGKNHFYRANRELGRLFKTEHILKFMSNEDMRRRNRRGLLKGEQLHGLARNLNYGQRGRLTKQAWEEQKQTCSCLTLLLACIIYWQAKEMHRVLQEAASPNKRTIQYITSPAYKSYHLEQRYPLWRISNRSRPYQNTSPLAYISARIFLVP